MTDALKPGDKGAGLKRRIELFEKSLETRILYHRGVKFQHLAQERLARRLESDKESLERTLLEERRKLAQLSAESEQAKQAAAEEVRRLQEQRAKLEEAGLLKDQTLASISAELKKLQETLAVFYREREVWRADVRERDALKETAAGLAREVAELKRELGTRSAELETALAERRVQAASADGVPDAALSGGEAAQARPSGALKRFAEWWKEPVAEIHWTPFSSGKK